MDCSGRLRRARRSSKLAELARKLSYVTGDAPALATVGAGDFDPADHADFTEVSEFVYGGPPRGQ